MRLDEWARFRCKSLVTDWREAESLLEAHELAFDIETDTTDRQWAKGQKRGVSYGADITHISFYGGPDYPLLVLEAECTEQPYAYESLEFDENDEPYWRLVETETHEERFLKADWEQIGSPLVDRVDFEDGTWWEAHPTSKRFVGSIKATSKKCPIEAWREMGSPEEETEEWVPGRVQFNHYGFLRREVPLTAPQYRFTDDQLAFIRRLLERPVRLIAHNLIFDARGVFGRLGVQIQEQEFWCTQVANIRTLGYEQDPFNPQRGEKNSLMDVYRRVPGNSLEMIEAELDGFKTNRSKLNEIFSTEEITAYVAVDSVLAWEIYRHQVAFSYKVKHGTYDQLVQDDLDYTRWGVKIAARGVRVDREKVKSDSIELARMFVGKARDLDLPVEEALKHLRSTQWVKDRVFNQLGIPEPTEEEQDTFDRDLLTSKGNLSVGWAALSWYAERYPENVELRSLQEGKAIVERLGALDEWMRHSEFDGRVHSIISRSAVTGRSRSNSPNLQNLTMEDRKRKGSPLYLDLGILVPDPGFVLVEGDLTNAEVRAAASMSGDKTMAAAVNMEDFHSFAAELYFGSEKWQSGTKADRKRWRGISKTITFGTLYGRGYKSIAHELNIPISEAKALVDGLFSGFPNLSILNDNLKDKARRFGVVALFSGRRVKVLWHYEGGRKVEIKAYTAINSLIQGMIGELLVKGINARMKWLEERGYETWDCLSIHDSIITQVKIDEYYDVMDQLIRLAEDELPQRIVQRTDPPIYQRITVDHSENRKKWGVMPDYPLPEDLYTNAFGHHTLPEGYDEAPTWNDENGWATIDTRPEPDPQPTPEPGPVEIREPRNFKKLERELRNASDLLLGHIVIDNRSFDLSNGMTLLETLMHSDGSGTEMYNRRIQAMERLYAALAEALDKEA